MARRNVGSQRRHCLQCQYLQECQYFSDDGGPIAMLFAATHPERTEGLVLGDTFARMHRAVDYPVGLSESDAERKGQQLYESWGRDPRPSRPTEVGRWGSFYDPSSLAWRARFERLSLSPGALQTMYPACYLDVDVRSVLGAIRCRRSCSTVATTLGFQSRSGGIWPTN